MCNFQLNWQVVTHSGYCYGVNTWHTLFIIISLSTYTCQHDWLPITKNIPIVKNKLQLYVCFSTWFVVEH